jgi:predicted RNA-binding Zn-ribbon protein involved in translation (DUF1610 family)
MTFVGICCDECFDEDKPGIYIYSQEVLEDGTVYHINTCNICGHKRQSERKPRRKRGKIWLCLICNMEFLEKRGKSRNCPNCTKIKVKRVNETREYGELCHEHGRYGNHPISRKHRK